jgi:hypothetical protein
MHFYNFYSISRNPKHFYNFYSISKNFQEFPRHFYNFYRFAIVAAGPGWVEAGCLAAAAT